MTEDLVKNIKGSAEKLFVKLGFRPVTVNNEIAYEYKGKFHKFTFVHGLQGFVIEYAESLDEAQKNLYEDCDIYQVSLGEKELLNQLQSDTKKYYLQG